MSSKLRFLVAVLLVLCLAGCDIQIEGLPTAGNSETAGVTQPLPTDETVTETESVCAHNYQEKISPAGCETPGCRELCCDLCGDVQKEELPALGHSFSDWKVDVLATCTEEGQQSRTCTLCEYGEKEALPAAGHTMDAKILVDPGSCTEPQRFSQRCSICAMEEETTVAALGHRFVEQVISKVSCTQDGEIHTICTVCQYAEVKIESATGHQYGEYKVLSEASCLVPGQRVAACTVCQDTVAEEIPASGHQYGEYKTLVEASCTKPGQRAAACAVCQDTVTEEIAALGHKLTETVTVKADCTHSGEKVTSCSACSYRETKVLAAKGHSYGAYEVLTPATCLDAGEKTAKCKNCDAQKTEVIPATGHNYGDGLLVKEAVSCAEPGLRRYTCTGCGSFYEKTITGPHTLGEPYVNWANLYRDCTKCDFRLHDLYAEWEPAYSDCDPNAALNTDTIKLKYTEYNGSLATWPEQWHKYADFFMGVIQDYGYELPADVEFYIYDLEFPSYEWLLQDVLACRQAFYEVYGWMPAEPYIEVWEGEEIGVVLDADAHYKAFRTARSKLSSARKEEIVNDLIAYHVLSSGVWDGMQAYNAIAHLHDRLVYRMVSYDDNLILRTPYDGLAGGSCVCEGYADIMTKMLEFCGIKCEKVVGTMMGTGHAWNRVTFSDGTVRYVDATNYTYRMLVLVPDYVLKYDDEYKWK